MIDEIMGVMATADAAATAFVARHGLACPAGCGACCANPGVHVRVAEMLPAAAKLIANGEADAFYDAATLDPEGRCVFFVPEANRPERGRCSHYDVRPGLCRLFGTAVRHDKYDARHVATCAILRRGFEDAVAAAERDVAAAPLNDARIRSLEFRALDAAVVEIAGSTSLAEFLPINRALQAALVRSVYRAPSVDR